MDRECVPFWGDYHCHYGLGQSLFMTSNQMMKIQKYSEFIFKQTAEYSWLISAAAAKPLETCSANRRVRLTAVSGSVWGTFCVFYTLLPPTCMASLRLLAFLLLFQFKAYSFKLPTDKLIKMSPHKDTIANYINPNKLKRIEYCSPCWTYRFLFFLLCCCQWCYNRLGRFGFDIINDSSLTYK